MTVDTSNYSNVAPLSALEAAKQANGRLHHIFKVVFYPHKFLRAKCNHVKDKDPFIRSHFMYMETTLHAHNGVGLASPQVGLNKRAILVRDMENNGVLIRMVNPVILEASRTLVKHEEGCLSLPGIKADVERPDFVAVQYYDANFEAHSRVFIGLTAAIVQHEIDHLDGVLFIDKLSRLKKTMLLNKYLKRLQND